MSGAAEEEARTHASEQQTFATVETLHTPQNTFEVVIHEQGKLFLRMKHIRDKQCLCVHNFETPPGGGPGPVERTGQVRVGDVLLSINDHQILGNDFGEAVATIDRASTQAKQDGVPRVLRFQSGRGIPNFPLAPIGGTVEADRSQFTQRERIKRIEEVLASRVIDDGVLRELASNGIPESAGLRGVIWRILLGYLPLDTNLWPEHCESHRQMYWRWVKELLASPSLEHQEDVLGDRVERNNSQSNNSLRVPAVPASDDPLNVDKNSEWARYFADQELMDEIYKVLKRPSDISVTNTKSVQDVIRTHPEIRFFLEDTTHIHYSAMQRILFVYAKLNPGVKYVQGMNELLGTLYYVLATDSRLEWSANAEADSFHVFTNLMSEVKDVFVRSLDDCESGIQGRIAELMTLLDKHDHELHEHLCSNQLEPSFFALRWITTLLSREFNLPDIIRVWDSLFADPNRLEFLLYMCMYMLVFQREDLLKGEFSSNLRLLQSYPPTDLQQLLEGAQRLRNQDNVQKRSSSRRKSLDEQATVVSSISQYITRTIRGASADAYGKVSSFQAYISDNYKGPSLTPSVMYAGLSHWITSGSPSASQGSPLASKDAFDNSSRPRSANGTPPTIRRRPTGRGNEMLALQKQISTQDMPTHLNDSLPTDAISSPLINHQVDASLTITDRQPFAEPAHALEDPLEWQTALQTGNSSTGRALRIDEANGQLRYAEVDPTLLTLTSDVDMRPNGFTESSSAGLTEDTRHVPMNDGAVSAELDALLAEMDTLLAKVPQEEP